MVLKCLPNGMFGSNCYIIGENGEGAVIDPGVNCAGITGAADALGLQIKHIIITHGHIDHICSMDELREKTGARLSIHENDAAALGDDRYNGSALFGEAAVFNSADELLKDGSKITIGGLTLEIIHTPGHSPGCICIKTGNMVFTGDTLFRRSIGRTDLGNGNFEDIIDSINNRLMTLDDSTVVYPGHGPSTTIGYEKRNNSFL